eukprot:403365813
MNQSLAKSSQKLKIICFHGYNNNGKVMEYQSRHLRKYLENVADFHFIDSPHLLEETLQAPRGLAERGFYPPFRSWMQIGRHIKNEQTGYVQRVKNLEIFGVEESVQHTVQQFKDHGPFDGVMSFSQGAIFFRHFYRIVKELDQSLLHQTEIPKFTISVGGPYFTQHQVNYKQIKFNQFDYKYDIDSLHIYGDQDELQQNLIEHEIFVNDPIVLRHQGGHNFPRKFDIQRTDKLRRFIEKQYLKKNANLDDFKIEHSIFDF